MDIIAKRYAQALFDATAAAERDAVQTQLESIARALEDPAARLAVSSPAQSKSARGRACQALTRSASAVVQRFVAVLLARRREALLPDLAPAFRALVLQARGEIDGVLESAKPVAERHLEALAAKASALTGKRVLLRVVEKPELIGGVRMRIGNTLFDSSVATAIEALERQLMAAPIH